MGDYLKSATRVLGDEHSFVHLVDTMPHMVRCGDPADPCMQDDCWSCQGGPNGRATTAAGDQRIVDAARVSIAGQEVRPTSDDRQLIRYLVKNKHTTPLEQVRFTFHVRLPIFVARQWIRHRTGSFNEQSARYGKLADDFYIPSLKRLMAGGQAEKNKQGSGAAIDETIAAWARDAIEAHCVLSYRLYEHQLSQGLARELARIVLPTNIYTQWYWTTDLHNLMHFLRLRLHPHAQWEFRRYAQAIVPMAAALAPYAMEAFKETLE